MYLKLISRLIMRMRFKNIMKEKNLKNIRIDTNFKNRK